MSIHPAPLHRHKLTDTKTSQHVADQELQA